MPALSVARESDAQIAAAAGTGVDIDALTAALAQRLAAVAPPEVRIATTERGMVDVLDVRGGGAAVDVLLAVAGYESESTSSEDRIERRQHGNGTPTRSFVGKSRDSARTKKQHPDQRPMRRSTPPP